MPGAERSAAARSLAGNGHQRPPHLISWLFAGSSPERFLTDFFERGPMHLTRRPADHYSRLLRFEDLDGIISQSRDHLSKHVVLSRQGTVEEFASIRQVVDPGLRLRDGFARGKTIILGRLERCSLPVARLTRAIEEWLSCPATAALFLTPPGNQGFDRHFDDQDTVLLQIEGRKRWWLYDRAVELPLERHWYALDGDPAGSSRRALSLRPGDLLYVPRGVPHQGIAGDSTSLHVTLAFRPYVWRDLLVDMIDELTDHDATLRHAASMVMPGASDVAATPAAVARVVAALTPMSIPAALERARERLIESLGTVPTELFWRRPLPTAIRPGHRLQRVPGAMASVRRRGDQVVLSFPGDRLQEPLAAEAALRFMAGAVKPFTIRALPGPLNEEARLTLAGRLVRLGFLSIVEKKISPSVG